MQSPKWINWIRWNNFKFAFICAINTTVPFCFIVNLSRSINETTSAINLFCHLFCIKEPLQLICWPLKNQWLPTVSFNPCVTSIGCVCGTVGAGESTTHCCPWGPETSLTFTWTKSECPAQARMGGRGGFKWLVHYSSYLITDISKV